MGTDSGFRAQRFQRRRFFVMFVNRVTDLAHEFDLRIGGAGTARMAAPARAESGLLGGLRDLKEAHLLTSWPSRGTGWATVNTGRAHRKNKAAVTRSVAREHRIPK